MTMRRNSFARAACAAFALFGLVSAGAQAQAPAAPAAGSLSSIFKPIPPDDVPGAIPLRPPVRKAAPEQWELMSWGGMENRSIRNVVNPTLTPVLPDPAKATGVAVIVAPGGGFRGLSIDMEGFKVARWLADRGIAAFVLKYRLIPTPRDAGSYMQSVMAVMSNRNPEELFRDPTPEALEDALAAVRLVRQRSAEWQLAPGKLGLIGYSAGAITALGAGLTADPAARPDFIAPIYPTMVARQVPADAPPMFLAIALDDPLFAAGKSLGLIESWRQAKRPLEVHLYEKGAHGFSMNDRFNAASLYLDQFRAWMIDRKIIVK